MNEQTIPSQPSQKPSRGFFTALLCGLLGGLIGACCIFPMLSPAASDSDPEIPENISYLLQGNRANSVIELVSVDTGTLMTPAEVYAANVSSTVGITASVTTNYFGYRSSSAASGSGFILSADGYILTNYHVIENSDSIRVSLYSGEQYDAQLVGYEESSDIAVLKIDATDLTPVILGDSDNLNVGDSVIAIGNPLGELTFTLTSGAISAKDREVTLSGTGTMNLLQTDCAINSGNSGGALFNLYGEVIGVTNAKYGGSSSSGASIDNIGFAIPINSVRNIILSILEKGYYAKPYVGISIADISAQTQQYGVPAGAAIQSVTEDSPAERAGLLQGDVITAVNGTPMTSDEIVDFVGLCKVGDNIVLSVYRNGEQLEITVTVGESVQDVTQNRRFPYSSGG